MSVANVDVAQSTRLHPYVLRSSLVAAVGGMLFGFDTAVIAGTTRALVDTYTLSPAALGVTVSSVGLNVVLAPPLGSVTG